jgi:hypothetical protein
MNDNVTHIEMLFDKAEDYGKTTIELLKLQAVRKSADVISSLISKAVITISVALSILILNIGVAIWLGKLTGEHYYGFFIVAGAYAFIALVFHLFRHTWIKAPLKNGFIAKMMNEN